MVQVISLSVEHWFNYELVLLLYIWICSSFWFRIDCFVVLKCLTSVYQASINVTQVQKALATRTNAGFWLSCSCGKVILIPNSMSFRSEYAHLDRPILYFMAAFLVRAHLVVSVDDLADAIFRYTGFTTTHMWTGNSYTISNFSILITQIFTRV